MNKLLRTDESSWTQLILRAAIGIAMFPHGAQKLLGWFGGYGFSATMAYMTHNGLPGVVVFLVILGEFFGALGLMAGLLTRIAAGGIALIMAGAALLVHLPNGFFMNWVGSQKGEGFEYHILAFAIAVAVVVGGGGKWSLDSVLARRLASREGVRPKQVEAHAT